MQEMVITFIRTRPLIKVVKITKTTHYKPQYREIMKLKKRIS